ncbi:MAG: Xaa-Pro dipeptidase [Pseudomonadota bacterium]
MRNIEMPDHSLYQAHLQNVIQSYEGALDAAGADLAVVYAGGLIYRFLDDTTHPFVVNPHFAWWLPLVRTPDCYVIFGRGQKPVLAYCQPDDYWHAVPDAPDPYWADEFDVRPIKTAAEARQHLPTSARAPIFIGLTTEPEQTLGIERINPSAAISWLDNARITKSDYEIQQMRNASMLGARAHSAARDAFLAGDTSEFEIHHAYLGAIQAVDHDLPYHSIVALNEHAAILHYQHRDRERPEKRRSFLIDAGAAMDGYASDITRTYAADSGLFSELIEAMDVLQTGICDDICAGVDYPTLHLRMHDRMAKLLLDYQIANGSAEALVNTGVTRVFLPHGLGHYLGLQVHDVGGHQLDASGAPTERPEQDPHLRLTRGLGPNEVITIEPGLYFIPMLLDPLRSSDEKAMVNWQRVDELTPFGGIRIEDNVRVLNDRCENLTRDAFLKMSAV